MDNGVVYTLQLTDNKIYVGKTTVSGFSTRMEQHFSHNGSGWTRSYRPLYVISMIPGDAGVELTTTLQNMIKYGIDNVRGASYVKVIMNEDEKKEVQRQIWSLQDKCMECGGEHFINQCRQINRNLICYRCDATTHATVGCRASRKINGEKAYNVCHKCGRDSHYAGDCYARTDVFGDKIE